MDQFSGKRYFVQTFFRSDHRFDGDYLRSDSLLKSILIDFELKQHFVRRMYLNEVILGH